MYQSKMKFTLLLYFFSFSALFGQEQQLTDYRLLYQEIGDTVARHFYDRSFIVAHFAAIRNRHAEGLDQVEDRQAFGKLVNGMLAELNTSHTHFYHAGEPEYYHLADIFSAIPYVREFFATDTIRYLSLGMQLKEINEKYFVANILAGGAAEKAGLKTGDQIVLINGQTNFQSILMALKDEEELKIHYRRDSVEATLKSCTLLPEWINPTQEFLRAQNGSIRVIEQKGKKIGYIHIWSYAGQKYHNAFVDSIAWGRLKAADALVWDLRDGWGGAAPDYLNVFNKNIPAISMINAAGDTSTFDRQWRKPVVMLINEGVRSGKEILAYGFKKYEIGPVVGTKTAGAVVGGRPFILSDGSLLYLAVASALADGNLLEGIGVQPDITAPFDLPYSQGKDPQLEKAVEEAIYILDK